MPTGKLRGKAPLPLPDDGNFNLPLLPGGDDDNVNRPTPPVPFPPQSLLIQPPQQPTVFPPKETEQLASQVVGKQEQVLEQKLVMTLRKLFAEPNKY